MEKERLLIIDGVINLGLGFLLLFFPQGIVDALGVPASVLKFYPSILGAVLIGIGSALFLERYGADYNLRGLGLGGAVLINLCGAGVLAGWLIFGGLQLPLKGYLALGSITGIVFLTALVELISGSRKVNTP